MKSDTALLMIDFQRDFCEEGGFAHRCGNSLDWVRSIIPDAKRLLEAARLEGVPIFHFLENYAPDLSDCPPRRLESSEKAGARYGSVGPMGRLMIRGEYGNGLIDELAALPDETVMNKPSYGAFATTCLDRTLRMNGISKLIIAGITADICVHTTLREATDLGYECFYVRDAISTYDSEIRNACEKMVAEEGGVWGHLATVDGVIRSWKSGTTTDLKAS